MQLWFLRQDTVERPCYETMVVAAETEEEARMMHPSIPHDHREKEWWKFTAPGRYANWARSLEDVTVQPLGTAVEGVAQGVICAAFWEPIPEVPWYVYMVQSQKDGSIYTGVTTDVQKRLKKHNAGTGAKHTRQRRPYELLFAWEAPNKVETFRQEYKWKQLTHRQKLELAKRKG